MLETFVVVDFETANPKRASVCQIGVAKVIAGEVAAVHTYPVCPPHGYTAFHPRNIAVHQLTPAYIEGAPEWPEILDRLQRFTAGLPLIGHNVAFERSVINAASEACGLEVPAFDYECTMKLAKHWMPGLPAYRLDVLAELLGVPAFGHHDAGEDARACAQVALAMAGQVGATTLADLRAPLQPAYRRAGVR